MHLNPLHPQNYNGFVHPDYLDHLKPYIANMPVEIDGVDIPGSTAINWAEKGMVESVSLFNCYSTYEAMVVKNMGKELSNFVQDCDGTDISLAFLQDYYFGDADQSISMLLYILNHPKKLIHDVNVISSICVQDLNFTDSYELEKFLLQNLNADERIQLKYSLGYHLHHYLRDPTDIRSWRASASSVYDWIKSAVFCAHTGDLKASRKSLNQAKQFANRDLYAWQMISQNYLFLLGDFDGFWDAMNVQIECCDDTFTFLATVEDLGSFVGGDEALSRARDLLNLAEVSSSGAGDYEQISYAWEQFFNDPERASHCRKIAGIVGNQKGSNRNP